MQQHATSAASKTLILVAEQHGCTHAIARALALRMRKGGHRVDVTDAAGGSAPLPQEYDAVILGTEAGRNRDRRMIGDYVVTHRAALQHIPTGLFLVCNSADALRHIDAFETRVGWRARFAAAFSYGGVSPSIGFVRRVLLAILLRLEGAVAERGIKELTALSDAMMNELTKRRART
jgi:menaquinone-dependent protoporphyrinogen IX oxidase